MGKVAVVLAGCGVFDGAEIHESVITLLKLAERAVSYQCLAPNVEQMHVVNHLTGEVAVGERRNVLVEAARIARGEVLDIAEVSAEDYDALVVPGGFGAAKNLCDFAVNGADMCMQADFMRFAQAMHRQGKPIGLMCIAPVMSAKLLGEGVSCTIGSDEEVAAAIAATGGQHVGCPADQVVIDAERKLVTTPAYMLAANPAEAAAGIGRLVDEVLAMVAAGQAVA